jgi:uncharacterized RDD family membrane protein YckC
VATAVGRLATAPARMAVRAPVVRRKSHEVQALATRRIEGAAGQLLAAPTTDRVVTDAAHQLLGSIDFEQAVEAALANPSTERALRRALASPQLEALVREAVAGRLAHEVTRRIAEDPEIRRAAAGVVSSPEVRAAITAQSASLAEEMVGGIRTSAARGDDRAERSVRRLLRWRRRAAAPQNRAGVRYAGIATRAVALAVDTAAATLVFLVTSALIGLVASLVTELRPPWLVGLLLAVGWALVAGAYFVTFWTVAGQTPGMRIMRLRLMRPGGRPPGVGRSLVRLVGLHLAIVPCFAGFLPVLFDGRRRGLPDYIAGTVVVYEHAVAARTPAALPPPVELVASLGRAPAERL